MTVVLPSALNIKLKFPEFAGIADATIEFAIEEAALEVDDTWIPKQATLAVMYLTGHHLMVSISRASSGTGQRLKSESMDGMSRTYDTDTAIPDSGDYDTTSYGKRYLELLGGNVAGVLLL